MNEKVIAVSQARLGSSRLPGKVFEKIDDTPLLRVHLNRVAAAKCIRQVVVAIPDTPMNDPLADAVASWGYEVSRGSEDDVLSRFIGAVAPHSPDYVVRVTSDCPFIDPELIDQVVDFVIASGADYGSNTLIEHFPDGQDIEVMTHAALLMAHEQTNVASDREHVTPWLKRNGSFSGGELLHSVNFPSPANFNHVRMCVDEPADLEVARLLASVCGLTAGWRLYTRVYLEREDIYMRNATIVRNEGYFKSLENDLKKLE